MNVADAEGRKHTLGEVLFAALLGIVVAGFVAVAAFVGAVLVCGYLFTGEASYSSLLWGPVGALLAGAAAFALTFRRILHHGDPPADHK